MASALPGRVHPAGYFCFHGIQSAPDAADPESWTFFFYILWTSRVEEQDATAEWTNAQRLRQVQEMARGFVDPWRSASAWGPDDHPVWHISLTDWDPGAAEHHWDNRGERVTLAGNAAHTMTYQGAQGLNHSMTDAERLCEAIVSFMGKEGGRGQKEAIDRYEEEMVARSSQEVRISTQNTAMLHDRELAVKSPVLTAGMKQS